MKYQGALAAAGVIDQIVELYTAPTEARAMMLAQPLPAANMPMPGPPAVEARQMTSPEYMQGGQSGQQLLPPPAQLQPQMPQRS
jgi:hypothetical protein